MTPYYVPVSSIPLLLDPPFTLWLFLVATAVGRRTLKLLGVSGPDFVLERGVLAAALGLGLLQFLPFGLGMLGVLTPVAVAVGLGVVSVLALPDIWVVLRALRREAGRVSSLQLSRVERLILLTMGVPLLLAFLSALTPPTDQDGLYYHLTSVKRWLQYGRLEYLPTLVHTNSLMGVNMLYALAMAVWSDTAAKLIHFGLGVLSLLSIIALGQQLKSRLIGILGCALWFIGFYVVPTLDASRLFSWAYVDLGLTAQTMAAVIAFLLWSRSRQRGWLLASALCAGFAATAKLTGVFVGAGLAMMVLAECLRQERPKGEALTQAVLFGCLALLPALPWFGRSFALTGSPVYLMLPKLFPTRDWSPEAGAVFSDYFKYYVWGTGYSSLGWPLATRKLFRAIVLLGTILGTGVALWRIKQWDLRHLVFLFGLLALACISSTGLYVRYLVPFLPLLTLPALVLGERLLSQKAWAQAGFALLILGSALLYVKDARTGLSDTLGAVTGRLSRRDFVERQMPVMALWEHTNRVVPRTAKVLLAAGRPSYFIEPYCFVTEAYYQNRLRMDTWSNFLADVKRDGIRYAIVPDYTGKTAPIGPAYAAEENELPFAHRLVKEHGRLLHTVATDHLYVLDKL
jgi:hypothetical protein